MKVLRIIPEFRILRLTLHRKSASKNLSYGINNSFSDLFSVCLKANDHLKLCTASFMIGVSKVSWVKVLRIIPEFRILRLTLHRKSASKNLSYGINNSFSDLFSVCLKANDHLIL